MTSDMGDGPASRDAVRLLDQGRNHELRWLDARYAGGDLTGAGVTVAMVDTGWDPQQPHPRVLRGVGLTDAERPFQVSQSCDDADLNGHGTACTHVLLDIAPSVHVMPIRVFGASLETTAEALVRAIDLACEQGIRLTNLSLGTVSEDLIPYLYAACSRARKQGMILVSAVPMGGEPWSYPAVFEPVLSVGPARVGNPYAIIYRRDAAVECAVRAHRRRVIGLAGATSLKTGTSYAAPVVTALIARWLEGTVLDLDAVRSRFDAMTSLRAEAKAGRHPRVDS